MIGDAVPTFSVVATEVSPRSVNDVEVATVAIVKGFLLNIFLKPDETTPSAVFITAR